jgi:hypothetical protein
MAADAVITSLDNWEAVRLAHQRFAHCDDGVVAEGFTDVVVRTLASHWSSFSEVAAISDRDPKFRSFLLRHINASADKQQLAQVAALAQSKCPHGQRNLCAAIRNAALER